MASKVILPKMGLTMVEGKISRWLKSEGDPVEKGDSLFELQTDKVTVEVEAEASGVLRVILCPAGTRCPVGTVVGIIASADEDIAPLLRELGAAPVAEAPPEPRVPSSPAARRAARELGVDISSIQGTGPGGRITERDVRACWEARKKPSATPLAAAIASRHGIDLSSIRGSGPSGKAMKEDVMAAVRSERMVKTAAREVIPLEGRRKTIADRMSESARTYAPVTITREVDLGEIQRALSLLRAETQEEQVKLTVTDLIAFALLKALRIHPELNSSMTDEGIGVFEEVNLGIAVDAPEGLIVPVIRDASRMVLPQLARERSLLAEAARSGKISPSELEGGTFTLSNLGPMGVDCFTPLINPPETAILGIGRALNKPWAVQGSVAIRPVAWLSLTFDHRVVDGAPAARFLGDLSRFVENPYLLLG